MLPTQLTSPRPQVSSGGPFPAFYPNSSHPILSPRPFEDDYNYSSSFFSTPNLSSSPSPSLWTTNGTASTTTAAPNMPPSRLPSPRDPVHHDYFPPTSEIEPPPANRPAYSGSATQSVSLPTFAAYPTYPYGHPPSNTRPDHDLSSRLQPSQPEESHIPYFLPDDDLSSDPFTIHSPSTRDAAASQTQPSDGNTFSPWNLTSAPDTIPGASHASAGGDNMSSRKRALVVDAADQNGHGPKRPRVSDFSSSCDLSEPAAVANDANYIDLVDCIDPPVIAPVPIAEKVKDTRIRVADFQCVICMDDATNLVVTFCGHLYCQSCLQASLTADARSKCPICRQKVDVTKKTKGFWPLELKLLTRPKDGGELEEVIVGS